MKQEEVKTPEGFIYSSQADVVLKGYEFREIEKLANIFGMFTATVNNISNRMKTEKISIPVYKEDLDANGAITKEFIEKNNIK